MTYCVGLMLEAGLVFMSDTRTNSGLDNISTFRKMFHFHGDDRHITLMTAGNLATTQAVVSLLEDRDKVRDERTPAIGQCNTMFEVARLVGETLQDVIGAHHDNLEAQRGDSTFNATLILGGQIQGGAQRLFLIYPEGNFIEATFDTPFFQIGETKYGRPILVRAYDPAMSFEEAVKLLMVSFDSTIKANLSVSAPLDVTVYSKDSLQAGKSFRIEADDPYFTEVSGGWGEALRVAFAQLPGFELPSTDV